MEKNSVICAIDVNDFDQTIVDLAATFAKHHQVTLHLLHVTPTAKPTNPRSANLAPTYARAPKELQPDNLLLREISTSVSNVALDYHHLTGRPAGQIIGFCERNEPVLLVMGTHGHRGVRRILGSVAEKVMRLVECPVMIIRHNASYSKANETTPPKTQAT